MSPMDVETFLAIKRQIARARWFEAGLTVFAVIALAAALVVSRGNREVQTLLLGFAIAAGVLRTAGSRTDVARDRLVELVEKQINSDSQALVHLARQHPSR